MQGSFAGADVFAAGASGHRSSGTPIETSLGAKPVVLPALNLQHLRSATGRKRSGLRNLFGRNHLRY